MQKLRRELKEARRSGALQHGSESLTFNQLNILLQRWPQPDAGRQRTKELLPDTSYPEWRRFLRSIKEQNIKK